MTGEGWDEGTVTTTGTCVARCWTRRWNSFGSAGSMGSRCVRSPVGQVVSRGSLPSLRRSGGAVSALRGELRGSRDDVPAGVARRGARTGQDPRDRACLRPVRVRRSCSVHADVAAGAQDRRDDSPVDEAGSPPIRCSSTGRCRARAGRSWRGTWGPCRSRRVPVHGLATLVVDGPLRDQVLTWSQAEPTGRRGARPPRSAV